MLHVSLQAEPNNHRVKLLQEWAEVEDEVIANKAEERMLALFKQVILVLEAIYVVSMQVVQHIVATI